MRRKNHSLPRFIMLVALACGLQSIAQAEQAPPHLTILQYHHVSTATPASTSISPEQFTRHLDWLGENDFNVMALPEALNILRTDGALPDKTVAITFDDGYLDNFQTAFPILRERNLPFTVFINPEPHDAGRKSWASWEQLNEMAAHGATIANHTNSHLFMVRPNVGENNKAWLQRLRVEVEYAESRIQAKTGQSHKILAYPYGESNKDVRELIEDLGFVALGQQSGAVWAGSDFVDLPRFPLSGVYASMNSFQTKMQSLPMAVDSARPLSRSKDNTLDSDETLPVLRLQLANKSQVVLNCFASGQDAINVDYKGAGLYEIQAKEALPKGRSRYNCTHASDAPGRYFWYSFAWIKRDSNNHWSHQ
jgi:biofilm PGA synthesis lipoprotein PgaB